MASPEKPKESEEEKALRAYQVDELKRLRAAQQSRDEAVARGRVGRAMLISGDQRGIIGGGRSTTRHRAIIPEPTQYYPTGDMRTDEQKSQARQEERRRQAGEAAQNIHAGHVNPYHGIKKARRDIRRIF